MSSNDTRQKKGTDVSPELQESGTMLDYLWNVQPEDTPGPPADEPASPSDSEPEKEDLSSTRIFRFTLSEYSDWLNSFKPK